MVINMKQVNPFYKSSPWLLKRVEILERDNYECQHCKQQGLYSKADCVHHIKHLGDSPELALVDENLISLCNYCHSVVHPEKLKANESNKFTNIERWE